MNYSFPHCQAPPVTLAGLERGSQNAIDYFVPEVISEEKFMSPLGLALNVGRVAASSVCDFIDSSQAGVWEPGILHGWSLSQTSIMQKN